MKDDFLSNKQKCKLKLDLSTKVQYKENLFWLEVKIPYWLPNICMKYLIGKFKKCFYWDLKCDIKYCICEWKIKLKIQEVFLQGFQVSYSRMYIIDKNFFWHKPWKSPWSLIWKAHKTGKWIITIYTRNLYDSL